VVTIDVILEMSHRETSLACHFLISSVNPGNFTTSDETTR